MIGTLSGTITHLSDRFIILDVQGIGYKVFLSESTLSILKLGEQKMLWTYLAVREDALDLYGFLEIEEQYFFEMLLGVSGIGPRGALGILSAGTLSSLKQAVGAGDVSYLTNISGIGKKTAEKIVIELRDKLALFADAHSGNNENEVLEALKALGFPHTSARDALQSLPSEMTDSSQRIKEAIKILGKK